MNATLKRSLWELGSQLDDHVFPSVKNGGVVTPNDAAVPSNLGEEHYDYDYGKRQRRSATRSWQRPSGGQGSSRGSGPSSTPSPDLSARLEAHYTKDLIAVCDAYQTTTIWRQKQGLWLLTESLVLPELSRAAIFVVKVPFSEDLVRGWGFWRYSLAGVKWIGPRHTNYPDGSICAFHIADATWNEGESLVPLLDLYTLWALRHLYLETFGRWPGPQAVLHPYERILELQDDELCGCGRTEKLYRDCCQHKDLTHRSRVALAVNFILTHTRGHREPPRAIEELVTKGAEPPGIAHPDSPSTPVRAAVSPARGRA